MLSANAVVSLSDFREIEMNTKFLKGIVFVALGAGSYGVLATLIKKGGQAGFSTAELTFSQVLVGFLIIAILNAVQSKRINPYRVVAKPTKKEKYKLMLGGTSMGLTSTFYYMSLQYTSVSVCIVMMMQSVWIGSLIEFIMYKEKPSRQKVISILLVLIGTVLATNLLSSDANVNWLGVLYGFLSGLTYSLSLFSSNNIATSYKPVVRSLYLLLGSLIICSLIWGYDLYHKFDVSVLWTWGVLIAFFGTVLSPLCFTRGMPIVGLGLGSIIASIELPVAVIVANIVLGETVNMGQWIGIFLIMSAVFAMNWAVLRPKKKRHKKQTVE